MRYVEGIFTSVCTCLCVRSFTAFLGLQNRLVNKEIELWVAILGILNCEDLMYIGSNVRCEAVQAHSGLFVLPSFNFGLFSVNSC